jgi:uncharacterized protein (DUF486 family)
MINIAHYPITLTALMLAASNVFMTFAWYGHLKNLNSKPWWIAALVSWGIALFEYLIQVPANRIGFEHMNLAQLKILQEVITPHAIQGILVPPCTSTYSAFAAPSWAASPPSRARQDTKSPGAMPMFTRR